MDAKDIIIQQLAEKLSRLEKIVIEQSAIIERQSAIIAEQTVRIAELEKRLGKNSNNSSKPPSSDGLSKPARTTSLRQKGKNKSGGQRGHFGSTLKQVSHPDIINRHTLNNCPDCAASLESTAAEAIIKRQVFDIPPPKMRVTEHQAEIKVCPCCQKRVTSAFPSGVNAPVQYGAVIQGWAVYLQNEHYIPEDRLQALFVDLLGVHTATATIARFNKSVNAELEEFESTVLDKIKILAVKHLDETGFRVSGLTQWLHVASTEKLTYYHISAKRKSLLEGLKGVVVHDHWKSYYKLTGVEHGLCNQHHLRELRSVIDYEKEAWAKKMWRFLRFALHYRHQYGDEKIPNAKLERLTEIYNKIVREGLKFHEQLPVFSIKRGRGRTARRTGHNLLLRLKNYREDVLRFLFDAQVPFTNNQAERDIRMMKCKQKISGGFRSVEGAKIFARIRGFISTARKQGWNVFESIQKVIYGHVPMPI